MLMGLGASHQPLFPVLISIHGWNLHNFRTSTIPIPIVPLTFVPKLAPIPVAGMSITLDQTRTAVNQSMHRILRLILHTYHSILRILRARISKASRSPPSTCIKEEAGDSLIRFSNPERYEGTLNQPSATDTTSTDDTLPTLPDATVPPTPKINGQQEREPYKKALLIGINYTKHGGKPLNGPHKDVQDMKRVLMEKYDYEEHNIVMLMDNGDRDIEPTRRNIMTKIGELLAGARAGDHFFFHYAGHGKQKENRDNSEEDGLDEYIVPIPGSQSSHNEIRDNELHRCLVHELPSGCSLVAVFDACHSASLLDLDHYRCNRVYIPWVSKGKRKSATRWNRNVRNRAGIISNTRSNPCSPIDGKPPSRIGMFNSVHTQRDRRSSIEQVLSGSSDKQDSATASRLTISTDVEQEPYFPQSPTRRTSSPERIWPCDGHCQGRKEIISDGRIVISLSAAKDEQESWEDGNGSSMTQALIKLLEEDPTPSFRKLLKRVSHDLHRSYLKRHDDGRTYKEQWRIRAEKARRRNQPVLERKDVETDNFQDPQLSSLFPLNMEDRFSP